MISDMIPIIFRSIPSLRSHAAIKFNRTKSGKPDENPVIRQMPMFLEKICAASVGFALVPAASCVSILIAEIIVLKRLRQLGAAH